MRAVVIAILLAAVARAEAYPQFQLSTGAARCNQCHYAPAGGGLINGYGRDEAGDTISMGGNGAFLHGLWSPPSWLALGADVRVAGVMNDVGDSEGAELAAFPMQSDLYARAQAGAFSLYVSGGFAGRTRASEQGRLTARLVSREHYVMWRPGNVGPYVRAGRFFAPYGLRIAEHPVYVRRFLGFNTLEETYGVSGGVVRDAWELHVTAFTPAFSDPVGMRGSGGAAYYERRLGDHAAAGAQARVAVASGNSRAEGGVVGKLYLEGAHLLLLAELDVVREMFDAGDARLQVAGYGSASLRLVRGLVAQLAFERWDEDAAVKGVARDAVDAQLQWFPTAHVELSLFGRFQLIGTGSADGPPSGVVLLQGHYYL